MTHTDPHHLLGGVAPDILTPEERKALYAAALEDQTLFDALGDEEALRELLADPAVRARLREALAPKVVPLWRRPALLGVAASLLLAGLATLAVRRNRVEVPKVEPAKPEAPATKAEPEPAMAAPQPAPTPLQRRRVAPPPPAQAPSPAPAAAAEIQADRALAQEKKAESERREAPRAPVAEQLDHLPKGRDLRDSANLAPGVAARGASGGVAKLTAASTPAPRPEWILEALEGGRWRAIVVHPATSPLVLLRRAPEGVQSLAPIRIEAQEGGRLRRTFEFAGGPGVAVDLYLLSASVARPEALPAEAPVAGSRVRIFPRTNAPER